MKATELVPLMAAILAILTALGGAVAWVASRMVSQARRFDRLEESYNTLNRAHTLLLVQLERFRLALQIAIATIRRKSPDDPSLTHIEALLGDTFGFPSEAQMKTPRDMTEVLREMDVRTSDEGAR